MMPKPCDLCTHLFIPEQVLDNSNSLLQHLQLGHCLVLCCNFAEWCMCVCMCEREYVWERVCVCECVCVRI